MIRYAIILITFLLLPFNASAQTPAESNPEAVYISNNYGIPQLNGRLILPGEYKNKKLSELTKPIASGWKKYVRTFQLDVTDANHMVYYATKTPGRLEQILRTYTSLDEERIRKSVEKSDSFAYGFGQGGGLLTQFEERAVMAALAEIYTSESHKLQRSDVPVTILLAATLSSYNFETQQATIVTHQLGTAVAMRKKWWEAKVNGERLPLGGLAYLDIPEDRANAIYTAAKSNPLGRNNVFIGVETSLSLKSNTRSGGIERVVYSFSWDLKNPFYVFDVSAKKNEKRAAEAEQNKIKWDQFTANQRALEQQNADLLERESGGFNREENTAKFESADLRIGTPPPDTLAFKRYGTTRFNTTQKGADFPATSAFFHALVEGGEIGFLTSDGNAQSPVVYFARYFSNKDLSEVALKSAAVKKLGQPRYRGNREAYWWDAGVPEDRSDACRPDITDIALGNAGLHNNKWSRHPLWVIFTDFPENCGIMGSMNFKDRMYAVADTTYFNEVLKDSVAKKERVAKEQETKVAKEPAAKVEKEFEF